MQISATVLLLALGACDGFTVSPAKPTLTSLQLVQQMSGGTAGSNLMDDSPPDINAPWGRNPVHDAPHYSAPTSTQFNTDYNGGEQGTYCMNGGTQGSTLLSDSYSQLDRDAPWGNKFPYEQPALRTPNGHAPNGMSGGTGGSLLVDGPMSLYEPYSPTYYNLHPANAGQGQVFNPAALPEQEVPTEVPAAEPVRAAMPPSQAAPVAWGQTVQKVGVPAMSNPNVQASAGDPSASAAQGPQAELSQ